MSRELADVRSKRFLSFKLGFSMPFYHEYVLLTKWCGLWRFTYGRLFVAWSRLTFSLCKLVRLHVENCFFGVIDKAVWRA